MYGEMQHLLHLEGGESGGSYEYTARKGSNRETSETG